MSTPSGKPSHPIELSPYLVRKAREDADAEPDPAGSSIDPPRSPYAPKRAHQRADMAANFIKSDSLPSDYAPKRAKDAPSLAPDAALPAEAPPLAPVELHQHPSAAEDAPVAERQTTKVAERQGINIVERRAIDAARQAIDTVRQAIDEAPLCPDKVGGDLDLDGLEASLRWLQRRQAVAMRLPPAPNLPPRSRRAPPDVMVGAHNRERTANAARSALRSLEPTRLVPPATASNCSPNTLLAISIACIFMAGIVYYYLEAGRSPPSPATSKMQVASVPAPLPTSATFAVEREGMARPQQQLPRAPTGGGEMLVKAEELPQPPATPPATSPPQQETVAMLQPAAAVAAPPASKSVRALDPEEISLLITEGEKHIATGDVVTARTIFQRAAQAGDATAALALAATYDPSVLAKLGVMGMGADVEKARNWYRMAESFGSAEAKQRLQLLDKH
jgi:hypothetical protein